ncbi:MAG: hypothetical protein WCS37_12040 [Chloroflexota bacterium]|nr:hypothetical protein [Chloroflexota bacterium]
MGNLKSLHPHDRITTLFLLLIGLALLLPACGDTPPTVLVVPQGTPTPSFRQETNQELFFIMSVPVNWPKTTDKDSVTFSANDSPNLKMSVVAIPAKNLTPTSTRILQEKLDSLKVQYPQMLQNNAGLLKMINNNLTLYQVSYTDNGTDLTEFLAQINVPLSDRAYLLSGQTLTAKANEHKPLFVAAFESFKANAPLTVPASLTAGAIDPTLQAINQGGKVTGANPLPGKFITQVEWQAPPLYYGQNKFSLSGLFPLDWNWRLKSFPSLDPTFVTAKATDPSLANPGIYLTAPDNAVTIQLGLVPYAFATEAPPSVEEYNRVIDPYFKTFKQSVSGLGSRNTISDLANVGTFFRSTFVVRSDNGTTSGRGVLLIRSAGRHLVMGVVTLSADASLKQNLVDGYDSDLQSVVSSLKVGS